MILFIKMLQFFLGKEVKMSIFEAGMMICFGAGWPVAVYKTWKAKCVSGKSLRFSYLVVIGYTTWIMLSGFI